MQGHERTCGFDDPNVGAARAEGEARPGIGLAGACLRSLGPRYYSSRQRRISAEATRGGEMVMLKRALLVAVVTAFVAAFAASAAFAGEATGNFGTDHGKNNKQTPIGQPGDTDPPHAASICSFSGQNPE